VSGSKSEPNWDASNNTPDYWIVKTDASGTSNGIKDLAARTGKLLVHFSNFRRRLYFSAANSSSPISGDKSQSSRGVIDYWIIKLDAVGTKQWDARFGGTANDYLTCVIQTSDGGYMLVVFSGSGTGGEQESEQPGRK